LLELAAMGAGMVLTSRDTTFGDGRLAPGNHTRHLSLQGLQPGDAYALASHVLSDLGIDRVRVPYAGLRDLLAELDYHPLAIQLVLPALRNHSLATIRAEFAALLPTFVDDSATGRSRSLLASLDYSLHRLSIEQLAWLNRFTFFEGGANEHDLLMITEIPEQAWSILRSTLEQSALMTVEWVHEDIRTPFLHFHPTLVPYLRSRSRADDLTLRERYAQKYYSTANNMYTQDNYHPEAIRALAWRELPNLRRALEILLQDGKLDDATDMAKSIAKLLDSFGLSRELDVM